MKQQGKILTVSNLLYLRSSSSGLLRCVVDCIKKKSHSFEAAI
jgi:hypothetical protein